MSGDPAYPRVSPPPASVPRGPFTGSHTLNVHAQRLKSEADAALLRNRLERLKQEEAKALKKIAETRRRADEIMQLKERNEHRAMQKRSQQMQFQREQEEVRQRAGVQKATREGALEASKTRTSLSKQQKAEQTRKERIENEEKAKALRERQKRRARQVYQTIKNHESQVIHYKMQERLMHEERLQAETEQKMLLEEAKRRDAERLVHDMEANEEVLIERLRRTQEAQKLAYEELELALASLSMRDTSPRQKQIAMSSPPPQAQPSPRSGQRASLGLAGDQTIARTGVLPPSGPPPRARSTGGTSPRSPRHLHMYAGPLVAGSRTPR